MSMNTYLQGRLRNTPLPKSHGLLPLFEAVVNSIHSIAELDADPGYGEITIDIIRTPQTALQLDDSKSKRGAPPLENIIGFKITDNGAGFHDMNMSSFETLDSDYKAQQGCRGVGRLLWLKAFEGVTVTSDFRNEATDLKRRSFTFTAAQGVGNIKLGDAEPGTQPKTCVNLNGFNKSYREKSPKTGKTIANSLFEHCLWYFVRDGGAPQIRIKDELELISLDDIYDEYMFSSAKKESVQIKGQSFELTHIKLKASSAKQHFIAWCAASRVVEEENIAGKVAGLHGKIKEEAGEFVYACYVTSPFLDQHVRPERIGFDIEEMSEDLFSETELNLTDIRNAVIASSSKHLEGYLKESQKAGRARVEKFVSHRAPRYRPILARISEDKLSVDPDISDKELDLILHKQLAEIEGSLLSEGHEIMNFGKDESPAQYNARLADYLEKADDIKKSDLANYVFHRKIILDILGKAVQRGADGKYAREELIHELIMPMRKTSNEVKLDSCNLWLIDERLAFHDFLASDKSLSTMPITDYASTKEPDICALNVFDEPILVADGQGLPLASIVIVEIKRPMRNDAAAGEEKDPVEQALGYLERIREGGAKTSSGRPIPRSDDIPGFCYAICDITPTVERRCKTLGLTVTSDHLGYFGYNPNYKAYIEVISFDRLLNSARQRNRAFFDKLGLPTT
ncbi:MAG: hypothetical protein Q8R61_04145 [Thiobacillus sp.]|uniref:hypothetical protein n=1 Tax=Thiobacillus sp. TaxID=924 RepID=UPI002734F0B0|nr:hypothetical protein [Thiobacillus sp.]MDP3584292.1 hypothetical protein [Thiobacillus sp.]